MAFSHDDTLSEILVKTMITEAWAGPGLGPEERGVVEDWVALTRMEGPEKERVQYLLDGPPDAFQAEIIHGELKAVLVNGETVKRMQALMDTMLAGRTRVHPLEQLLKDAVDKIMQDKSQLEKLVQDVPMEPYDPVRDHP